MSDTGPALDAAGKVVSGSFQISQVGVMLHHLSGVFAAADEGRLPADCGDQL